MISKPIKQEEEIKIWAEIMCNLRYADNTSLIAESEDDLKSVLMKVKGEWKSWLKSQQSKN